MSRSLWRIASDTRACTADDLSGTGARVSGGRWNDAGVAMGYASHSRALACLETVVHLNAGGLPVNRYLVEIVVPDEVWDRAEIAVPAVGWDAEPAGAISVATGSDWIAARRSLLMFVPSVIVPEDQNALINPLHPEAARLTARKIRKWLYDPRLIRRR